ncbi:MAG: fumarylacetoacetate hydrolase family protein [Candidatus Lustribacter sp.]|jgi:2-keto-4-pentenoate hydratase/2-oxohepta-3-ene-1,7-dioic acid hydratase in catechol pathway
MKLLRFGEPGHERPGALDAAGTLRDLSGHVADIDGRTLGDASLDALRKLDLASLPAVPAGTRIGPCVGSVGKYVCIGLNYADHAAEAGMKLPGEPTIFMKATSSIIGPNDDVRLPRNATQGDWEVELGFAVGRAAAYVSESEALSYVAGYFTANDVSERDFQINHGGQWTKGKSCDTFGPIGPWLVTRDEVADPQKLNLQLAVNGVTMQSSSTSKMVFGVAFIVSYLSRFMTLHPGDIVATGTPSGVGLGRKPQVFLKGGDRMTLSVEGLGEQSQLVVA